MRPVPDPVRPGQRSVWDFPRPPTVQPNTRHLTVTLAGTRIAETRGGWVVLETSHPPAYYLPVADIRAELLRPAQGTTRCEFKGQATYLDAVVGDRVVERCAWQYPMPTDPRLEDHIAFYAGRVDRCTVDGEIVLPQAGPFYGGWITSDLAGPFKGGPGTEGW